jgi:hypothetical protein
VNVSESSAQNPNVFISYSRKDQVFASRFSLALRAEQVAVWIDSELEAGSKWRPQLERAIESAPAFIFLMSPDSLISEYCHQEIEYARRFGKLLLPILRRDVNETELAGIWIEESWDDVARANWKAIRAEQQTFIRRKQDCNDDASADCDADSLQAAVATLANLIKNGAETRRYETILLQRAVEWNQVCSIDLLLRNDQLLKAETWHQEHKPPLKTEDVRSRYIVESRRAQDRDMSARRNIRVLLAAALVIILLVGSGYLIYTVYVEQLRQQVIQLNPMKAIKGLTRSAPFAMNAYEVSRGQYALCLQAGACRSNTWQGALGDPSDKLPIAKVTVEDGQQFCKWIGGSLPTLDQWKAAAFGEATPPRTYPWIGERVPSSD